MAVIYHNACIEFEYRTCENHFRSPGNFVTEFSSLDSGHLQFLFLFVAALLALVAVVVLVLAVWRRMNRERQ